jgi:hypothetical protein
MNAQAHFGDVPAWIAIALSSLALFRNWRSSKWEKQSAEAAVENAKQAGRANEIALRKLGISDQVPGASDARQAPPDVVWRLEKGDGAQYVLRNVGTDPAEDVYVDESRAPRINRYLPEGLIIQPGVGHTMLLKGSWQQPMPNELWVRWAGHEDWFAVPMPG